MGERAEWLQVVQNENVFLGEAQLRKSLTQNPFKKTLQSSKIGSRGMTDVR